MTANPKPSRLAVFASGTGSNFDALWRASQRGQMPCTPVCVVSNRRKAPVLGKAKTAGLPAKCFGASCWKEPEPECTPLIEWLEHLGVDTIVLAGFLRKLPEALLLAWPDRVLNIHPALLPAFGGPGMYGAHVHEAVFRAGARVSGATIHLVNGRYDDGPILAQRAVDLDGCDTPAAIAARVLRIEHQLYSETLARMCRENFRIKGSRVDYV